MKRRLIRMALCSGAVVGLGIGLTGCEQVGAR